MGELSSGEPNAAWSADRLRSEFGSPGGVAHTEALRGFQESENAFVFGRDTATGNSWLLHDGAAKLARAHVRSEVVCPVPGCGSPLTTVSRTRGRDGLRHLYKTSGHSRESEDHANACAAIEHWLRERFPQSIVRREENSNGARERRADVMITGRRGHRIAFEIQYSPLTPDDWLERHDSYRRQGIVDVWLFGHRGAQWIANRRGALRPNPTHERVVKEQVPLLFINAEKGILGIATGMGYSRYGLLGPLPVLTGYIQELRIERLGDFDLDPASGLKSPTLLGLLENARRIEKCDARELRRREEQDARNAEFRVRRGPEQDNIRNLLSTVNVWRDSPAELAIRTYFGKYLKGRIDEAAPAEPWQKPMLSHWQCALYFILIAGQEAPFDVPHAARVIRSYSAGLSAAEDWRAINFYLHRLTREGYLNSTGTRGNYTFIPRESGSWW